MKRLKIIGLLAAFLFVVVIILVLITPSSNIKQEVAVPSFFNSTISYDNSSLLLANGRSFVIYNYVSGQTKILGVDNIFDYSLDNIDSVSLSANKQFIVFHSQEVPSGSALSQLLQSDEGVGSNNYFGNWFVYNTESQQYEVLPSGIIEAVAYGNNVDGLSVNTNNQESIIGYQDNNLSQISSANIPSVSKFYPVNGGYLLEKPNNQVLFTPNGDSVQNLYSSTVIDGISSDGNTAIGTMSSGNKLNLAALNFQSSSYQIIASNISEQAVWSKAFNQALYLTSQSTSSVGQINSYLLNTNKTSSWKLGGNLNSKLTPEVPLGNNSALVSQNSNSYLLIGNDLSMINIPKNNYSGTINYDGQSITMSYSSLSNTLMVYESGDNASNTSGLQQAIYQKLRQGGYNPYLVKIMVSVSGI